MTEKAEKYAIENRQQWIQKERNFPYVKFEANKIKE